MLKLVFRFQPWLLSVCSVVLGTSALAGKVASRKAVLAPEWKKQQANQWNPNVSFLNNLNFKQGAESFLPQEFQEFIDPSSAGRIQKRYESLSREHEIRQNHGLVDLQSIQTRNGQLLELRTQAMDEVREYQKKKQGSKIIKAIERDEDLKKPVSIAVAVAAAVTGSPFQTKVGESAQVTVAANVPFQTSYIQFHSQMVDGSFTATGDQNAGNSITLPPPEWVIRRERYRFSLSRSLPVWGLGSEVAYGGSSNTVTASLSKALTENLKCSINTIQSASSLASSSEQNLKLDYRLRF
jgi:hypothetical protein